MLSERESYLKKLQNSSKERPKEKSFRRERSCNYLKRAIQGVSDIEVNSRRKDEVAINVYVRVKPLKETEKEASIRLKNNSLAIFKDSKTDVL